MHDPYVVAWKLKSPGKLIAETVGHVPKELSRAAWFFLERGGKISGNVFEEKYQPSPIPKGGLEIMLEVELKIGDNGRNILEWFQNIIGSKYEIADNAGEYPIFDKTVINMHRDNFGATPECVEDENEEDHLIDDEDDDIICID